MHFCRLQVNQERQMKTLPRQGRIIYKENRTANKSIRNRVYVEKILCKNDRK